MPKARALAAACAVVLLSFSMAIVGSGDEQDLLARIKNDVFDQKWDAVLASCDQFISKYPSGADLARATYFRAKALENLESREDEAIAGYATYLTKFPQESGTLREDALLSRITLARILWLKGNKGYGSVIVKGMDEKGYPRLYAAIQAAKIDYAPAIEKALPILKDCAATEKDAELKNECVLALLRIDPQALKGPSGSGGENGAAPAREAKMIRVEVYDKIKKTPTVQINMPIAFADALMQALSEGLKVELEKQLEMKGGLDLTKFFEAVKKGGPQVLVEIDNEEQHIKLWIE